VTARRGSGILLQGEAPPGHAVVSCADPPRGGPGRKPRAPAGGRERPGGRVLTASGAVAGRPDWLLLGEGTFLLRLLDRAGEVVWRGRIEV